MPDLDMIDRNALFGGSASSSPWVRRPIRIWFTDWWIPFDPADNIFTFMLQQRYEVVLDKHYPEILFFSAFSENHRGYRNAFKIFVTGENVRPPMDLCNLALSFDHLHHDRHRRLPLHVIHMFNFFRAGLIPHFLHLAGPRDIPTSDQWLDRRFCCFVYSNPNCEMRNRFFTLLNERKRVDAAGRVLNNTGYLVKLDWWSKIRFLSQYRFCISFENSSHSGYTTEKLSDSLLAGCIPIYWGNPDVFLDYNPEAFVGLRTGESLDALVDRVLELEASVDSCREILMQRRMTEEHFRWYDLAAVRDWIVEGFEAA